MSRHHSLQGHALCHLPWPEMTEDCLVSPNDTRVCDLHWKPRLVEGRVYRRLCGVKFPSHFVRPSVRLLVVRTPYG